MDPVIVDSDLIRPENRWARALFMAAVLTVGWGLSRLVPIGFVMVVVFLAGVIAISVLMLNRAWVVGGFWYKTLALTALMASIITVLTMFLATGEMRMQARGTKHTVTVTGERKVHPVYRRSSEWHYTLAEGGIAVPGELVTSRDDYQPGETIEVYSLGEELMTADEAESPDFFYVIGNAGYLVSLPLMLAAGYFAPMRSRRAQDGSSGRHRLY